MRHADLKAVRQTLIATSDRQTDGVAIVGAVSYTHLTLPTKRIV